MELMKYYLLGLQIVIKRKKMVKDVFHESNKYFFFKLSYVIRHISHSYASIYISFYETLSIKH